MKPVLSWQFVEVNPLALSDKSIIYSLIKLGNMINHGRLLFSV